ncbi:hypothetical protein PsorP6_005864 [Peronosclerospora sorghi]|uniref:Uncharacterized protein n=1 Tax=Peronosclerospora sorghi TaxID=230839 RepID=A0ACC0W5U1_9STRA|nr:hypothetical protein PsorP6_005864 [Peronosclerospora sorghi]
MARSKEQWRAQQQALHSKSHERNVHSNKRSDLDPRDFRTSAPLPSSSLRHFGPKTGASRSSSSLSAAQAQTTITIDLSQTQRPSSHSVIEVIDLTLDDEEDEEEDEPMETRVAQLPESTSTAVSSVDPDTSMLDQLQRTKHEETPLVRQGEATRAEMSVPLAEDVESDVDEEWPVLPTASRSTMPSMSVNDKDESRKNDKVTLDDKQDGITLVQNDEVEPNKLPQLSPPLLDVSDNKMETEVSEKLLHEATTEVATRLSPTPDQVDSLEDGEIFEEREIPIATMQLTKTVDNCRHVTVHSVDEREARTYLRTKKQKKRGKKKTKRKLDAMQMMHVLPGELHPEFERTARQRPFVDAQQYSHETMRKIPRSDPLSAHQSMFRDPPPAPFRTRAIFQQPHMTPQRLYPSPAPLYGDSQILRVNRQGSTEMFKGGTEPLLHTMSSLPIQGGFKYRHLSISSSPSMSNAPGFSLQRSVSSSSWPSPSRGNSINSGVVKERSESQEYELDSLRAAALRTKAMRSQKVVGSANQSVKVVQQSTFPPSSEPAPSDQEENKSKSAEIDELRLEILRSMEKKRNQVNDKSSDTPLPPNANVSEVAAVMLSDGNRGDKANSCSAPHADLNVTKGLSNITLSDPSANANIQCLGVRKETEVTSNQKQTDGRTCVELAANSKQTEHLEKPSEPTPEFRPLTACSQSLVIQLNSEDFLPRKNGDDTQPKAPLSSSLQNAIEEMRRKIAEREKEQTNRSLLSAATGFPKESSSSSSNHLGLKERAPSGHTVLTAGVSVSVAESVEDLSARNELETELSAQIGINLGKTMNEQVSSLPSESRGCVAVESAAGPSLELGSRSVTLGVSKTYDTHILYPPLTGEQ